MYRKNLFLLYLLWLVIFPVGLWLTYQTFTPSQSLFSTEILSFLLFAIVVCLFPILVNETPVFFLQAVSLVVFLKYGLFAEMVLTQIAIFVLLIKLRLNKDEIFRFPLNSLMFFCLSIISALVFYKLGGQHDLTIQETLKDVIPLIGYVLTYLALNQTLLVVIRLTINKKSLKVIGRGLLWESISSLIVFPMGIVLYVLYNELHLFALLIVCVPLVSIAIILRMYYTSLKMNDCLQQMNAIGHQLTEGLQVQQVDKIFTEKVTELFAADYTYVFKVNKNSYINPNKQSMEEVQPFNDIAGVVISRNNSLFFKQQKEWKHLFNAEGDLKHIESMLAIPIQTSSEIVGVLILASKKRRYFENYQEMISCILCSYYAIALVNAVHYEETKRKSQYCSLTGVYNYGYFEELLTAEYKDFRNKKRSHLSLILLDLDFFKQINDTYGHESGNEMLCQVTSRIQARVGKQGIVARYGGEEFVILLSNTTLEKAVTIAEHIRMDIASKPFSIHQHLDTNDKEEITITVSIGVATAKKDDEEALSLVRYADRAMYTGAKKAGRNKVAVYDND
ncbi:sensor domain-containing diguanylate cyclase [Bacillus sp. JJ722]|uniref:sensor domain-containing diguanylate cyclase n=1 Tax=Bacillus sp. JJ722 TaxID=3122973 RepID=UPI002FFD964A